MLEGEKSNLTPTVGLFNSNVSSELLHLISVMLAEAQCFHVLLPKIITRQNQLIHRRRAILYVCVV